MIEDLYLADSDAIGGAEESFDPERRWDGVRRQSARERLINPAVHGLERESDDELFLWDFSSHFDGPGADSTRIVMFVTSILKLVANSIILRIAREHVDDLLDPSVAGEDNFLTEGPRARLRDLASNYPEEYARYAKACQRVFPGIDFHEIAAPTSTPVQNHVPEKFRNRVVYSM